MAYSTDAFSAATAIKSQVNNRYSNTVVLVCWETNIYVNNFIWRIFAKFSWSLVHQFVVQIQNEQFRRLLSVENMCLNVDECHLSLSASTRLNKHVKLLGLTEDAPDSAYKSNLRSSFQSKHTSVTSRGSGNTSHSSTACGKVGSERLQVPNSCRPLTCF